MHTSLLRKSMVCGAIVILVLLSFTPIIDGINVTVENQSELTNEENDKNSIFTNADKNRTPRDISENQLKNHLPRMRLYNLNYYRTCYFKSEFSMHETHDAFSDEKANIIEARIGSRDDYTPHDPISIDGDDDFTEENGVTGGTGTFDDPYIIEGWEITTGDKSIEIKRTTAYFIVRHCLLHQKVYLFDVTHGTLEDIDGKGINIKESSDVMINDSELSYVKVEYSSEVSIISCNISASTYEDSIGLFYSGFNFLSNLNIKNGWTGIVSWVSHNNTIIGCDISSNNFGIALVGSEHGVLRNNTIYDNTYNFEIYLGFDTYDIDMSNTINGKPMYYIKNENNLVFDGNEDIGFFALINCENIEVKNFITNGNAVGIVLAGTNESNITSSTFNDGGYLYGSSNNFVDTCTFDGRGIWIDYSPNNKLRNIDVTGGDFSVYGEEIEEYHQDIDLTNMRGGKPIYYVVGENNRKFNNLDCGYLGLVSCKNIEVTNVEINDNWEGLLLVDTSGVVKQCSFSNDVFGIRIALGSSPLTISSCTLSNNEDGVNIVQSSNIQIKRCTISNSGYCGLYFENSHDNIITRCTISNIAVAGLRFVTSWDNQIDHNTITYTGNEAVGIRYGSWGNEISDNTITFCYIGVRIMESSWGNKVHHNTINRCDFMGVEIYSSDNNSVTYNNIKNSERGVSIILSNGNNIDHNNIVGNDEGAVVAHGTGDVRYNWWGSPSGPGGVGLGSGDIIKVSNGTVFYEPWLQEPVIRDRIRGIDISRNFLNSFFVYILEQFPILQKILCYIL